MAEKTITIEALSIQLEAVKDSLAEMKADVAAATKEMRNQRPTLVAVIGPLVVICPGLLWAMTQIADNKASPLTLQQNAQAVQLSNLSGMIGAMSGQAAQISDQGGKIGYALSKLEETRISLEKANENLATLNKADAEKTAKFAEVETQFHASDQTRNIQFADQQRFNAEIYQDQHGKPYPLIQFFPEISAYK